MSSQKNSFHDYGFQKILEFRNFLIEDDLNQFEIRKLEVFKFYILLKFKNAKLMISFFRLFNFYYYLKYIFNKCKIWLIKNRFNLLIKNINCNKNKFLKLNKIIYRKLSINLPMLYQGIAY